MKKGAKIAIGVAVGVVGVFAIAVGTVYGIWNKEINSVLSIKEIVPPHEENQAGAVYEMTMDGGYYFDDFLAKGGAKSDDELIDFIVDNLTKGLFEVDLGSPDVGCSSFAVTDEKGNNLFGRNYDFSSTNSLILHTNPGNGRHASISSVDLQFLNLSEGINGIVDSLTAIAAAYAPLDGMNDAGVSCGIYMSYQGPDGGTVATDQNTELPDLTSTTMLRLILDYADNVDEAVELVKRYDFHDSANSSFHYMVADASGKSAILEWVTPGATDLTDLDGSKRELKVYYNDDDAVLGANEAAENFQYVTNFIVTPDYYETEDAKKGLDRYEYIHDFINGDGTNNEGIVSREDCMTLLEDLGRRKWKTTHTGQSDNITVWSVLYDLDNLTATWVSNEEFGVEGSTFNFSLR